MRKIKPAVFVKVISLGEPPEKKEERKLTFFKI